MTAAALLSLIFGISHMTSADFIHSGQNPVVTTIYGQVRGNQMIDDVTGRTVDEFLGIPYATPPVGTLRWTRTRSPEAWQGEYDATKYSPHCVHFLSAVYPSMGYSANTSEDCLYLNVYVPKGLAQPLPVMVWIHGGGYCLGTAAKYPGHELAIHGDVIVVGFNYRLSPLGWATTGDAVMPGNYGMWDTRQALIWVRDNIEAFGGDPDSVTVFGQSAGGAMTSHVMISPQTSGLLHRGIPVSGVSNSYFGLGDRNNTAASTFDLARWVLCPLGTDTSQEVYECLMEEDAETLDFWSLVGVVTLRLQPPNWMPVIDGLYLDEQDAFIPRHPADSWRKGDADDLDLLVGHCHHDSAAFINGNLYGIPTNTSVYGWAATLPSTRGGLLFINNVYDNPNETVDAMYEQYPLMSDPDDLTRVLAVTQATTDWWYESPASFEAEQHSITAGERRTYLYDFHYIQSFLGHPYWVEASHMDDIYAFLGDPYLDYFRSEELGKDFTPSDVIVKNDVMSYYTNFARTGDPNVGINPVSVTWPQFNSVERNKMKFEDQPRIITEDEDMLNRYRFWQQQWPTIAVPKDPWSVDGQLDFDVTDDEYELNNHEQAVEKFLDVLWGSMEEIFVNHPYIWENILDTAQRELKKLEHKRRSRQS